MSELRVGGTLDGTAVEQVIGGPDDGWFITVGTDGVRTRLRPATAEESERTRRFFWQQTGTGT